MASINKCYLKNTANRPNFAKRSMECGMKPVYLSEVQKLLKKDWEKDIERSGYSFNAKTVEYNLKQEVYSTSVVEFLSMIEILKRNGLLNKYGIHRLFAKRSSLRRRMLTCQHRKIMREIRNLRVERDDLLSEKILLESEISTLTKNLSCDLVKKE